MDDKDKSGPAWFYGPKGESAVFESGDDVPSGWKDHPSKHAEKAPAAPKPPVAPIGAAAEGGEDEVDADAWPWQANLHAASKSKTGEGLWRMKVGVSRPEPKKLDL